MLNVRSGRALLSGLLLAAGIAATSPDAFAQPDARYVSHAGPCSRTSACLQNDWFDVSLRFYDPGADVWKSAGFAEVDVGHESALIYFFSATNLEMLVKVLDGNEVNGRFWVFAAAATDLGFQLKVRDTETGWTNEYHNPPGNRPLAVTDTYAFVHDGRQPPADPDPDPDPDLDHPNGTQPIIIHIFRQGQKRSSQGIFLEISFSSKSTFAVSRKQTEQAILQL